MAWTDPTGHIYAVSEVLTAATMNTYVEADISFLYGDAAWTAVSYTNSWVDMGAPFIAVAYRKVGTSVRLRGGMKNGTLNTAAFTLPVGYRPGATAIYSCLSNSLLGAVSIASTGVVMPGNPGSNASVFLDGMTLDTI